MGFRVQGFGFRVQGGEEGVRAYGLAVTQGLGITVVHTLISV